METFTVLFAINSCYEDESLNLSMRLEQSIEADNLDSLFEILDDPDFINTIDDSDVINQESDQSPVEVNVEYIRITDTYGSLVYEDND